MQLLKVLSLPFTIAQKLPRHRDLIGNPNEKHAPHALYSYLEVKINSMSLIMAGKWDYASFTSGSVINNIRHKGALEAFVDLVVGD